MKKILAGMLAISLLLAAPLALAEKVGLTENASGFDLSIDLPAGATVSVQTEGDVPYTFIKFADETMPQVYISVAPTEEYDEDTITALSKSDQDTLFAVVSADLDKPSYSLRKTSAGYDYMLIEDDSQTDTAILVLLYGGYFVQISVWNANYDVLTAEDMSAVTSLVDTLSIIPVA